MPEAVFSAERPLALTMGDPSGIGGEITLAAWRARHKEDLPVFFALDDLTRLRAHDATLPLAEIAAPEHAAAVFSDALPVFPVSLAEPAVPGCRQPVNASATITSIDYAVDFAKAGRAGGVVTNPINKAVLYEGAGFAHPGHTEYLAHLGGVSRTIMMLAAPGLRVVPVTIHIALAEVPHALTAPALAETIRITAQALWTDFGIKAPRIAVAGLNPHAGENGAMGTEEITLIAPVLDRLRRDGLDIVGPLPADTMFHPDARARYDVAVCMYHDQALVPLKTLDFNAGVNVTLGLPFIRTSPDHGTAYDIAGQGKANPQSLIEALRLARSLARNRQETLGQ